MAAVETRDADAEHKSLMQSMADGQYYKIRLSENPAGADQKWGPQYVAVNDYGVRIPRSLPGENKDVILAEIMFKALQKSAETRSEILIQHLGILTAEQAHEERLLGHTPVYPAKVQPSKIAADAAETKKGK